jgi:DNA-directed RNA polymerase specialized sigma24 family protein
MGAASRHKPCHQPLAQALTPDQLRRTPVLWAVHNSSLSDLTHALRGISMKHRQALLLHHVIGLSVAEVASEMSAKPGTVKSWLSRGRAELERQLHYQEAAGND